LAGLTWASAGVVFFGRSTAVRRCCRGEEVALRDDVLAAAASETFRHEPVSARESGDASGEAR
jgi:hypothetical protein